MKYLHVALSVVLSVGILLGFQHVNQSSPDEFAQVRSATWNLVLDGVDPMWGTPIEHRTFCSGVAIKPDLILTAAHCDVSNEVPGSKVTINGKSVSIVKKDVDKDLMLLFVPTLNSPTVPIGLYEPLQDSPVVVVGYPLGLTQYVTEGRVQGFVALSKETEENLGHKLPTFMALSALVEGGNSGGGVFQKVDGVYTLVGITSMKGGMITLVVPTDVIAKFLDPINHP